MSETIITMIRTKRAWYAHPAVLGDEEAQRLYGREELGLHCHKLDESGEPERMEGEIYLRWFDLDGKPSPHLQVFDDSWNLLPMISPLLSRAQQVLDEDNRGPDAIEELFKSLGVKDVTETLPKDPDTRAKFERALERYNSGETAAKSKPARP